MNTMLFADGAWEGRSRSEEEAMSGTSATTSDTEIARNPHQQTSRYSWDETLD